VWPDEYGNTPMAGPNPFVARLGLTNTGNNDGWLFTGDENNATTYIKNNSFTQLLAGSAVTICR